MQEEMAQSLPGPVSASQVLSESWATSPAVRRVMQGNKSRDTKPEIAVRSAVHALGMRYRVSARPLPDLRRTADLVFRNARVAVLSTAASGMDVPCIMRRPRQMQATGQRRSKEIGGETGTRLGGSARKTGPC